MRLRLHWQCVHLGTYTLVTEEEAQVVARLSLCLDGWHTHIWPSTLTRAAGLPAVTRLDTDTAGLDTHGDGGTGLGTAEHHIFQRKGAAIQHIKERARSAYRRISINEHISTREYIASMEG